MPEARLDASGVDPQVTRGLTYPKIGDKSGAMTYVKSLFRQGEPDMLARAHEAMLNMRFEDGDQWLDWNSKDALWRDMPNPDGRVRHKENLIKPVLRARSHRLLSSEIVFSATPTSNASRDIDRARISERWLNSHWEDGQMNSLIGKAVNQTFTAGGVLIKQFWNGEIGALQAAKIVLEHPLEGKPMEYLVRPDGTPIASETTGDPVQDTDEALMYRPGDVDHAIRTVFDITPNPEATGMKASDGFRWLIDTTVMPVHVARERYKRPDIMPDDTDGHHIMRFKKFATSRVGGGRSHVPSNRGAGSSVNGQATALHEEQHTTVHEYWEVPSAMVPDGRLTILAGRIVVFDGNLPQGFVPYVDLDDEDDPFNFWGRPVVRDLVPPQKVLNQQWSLILEELERTGIGQWAAFDIPGLADQIGNEHGAILKIPWRAALQGRSITNIITRMQNAKPPTDRYNLIEMSRRSIFDIGAFHEISRGSVPPGVASGIAVQLLQESENQQLSTAIRGIRDSLIRIALQSLRVAKWGYGEFEDRWINSSRDDLDFMLDSIRGGDIAVAGELSIDLRGFRPQSRAALNAEVRELMQIGALAPEQGLKLLDMGRGMKAMFASEGKHWSRARFINKQIVDGAYGIFEDEQGVPHLIDGDGGPFMLAEFDDHAIHLEVLNELILDDSRPVRVRQAAMVVAVERRLVIAAQQQDEIDAQIAIANATQANQKGA